MAFTLYSFMDQLKSIGGFDILLPFILFYAILVGLQSKVAPWKDKKSLNQIIALAVSLFIVAFTPFGMSLGAYLTGLFGGASVYIVGLLVLLLILGMFGVDLQGAVLPILGADQKKAKRNLFIILILLAAGVWYFTGPAGTAGFQMTDTVITIIILAVILGLVLFIGGGEKKKPPETQEAEAPAETR